MPDGDKLKEAVLELIKKCATDLPPDIVHGLKVGQEREEQGSLGFNVFTTLLEDVEVARQNTAPLCQDTGTPLFFVDYPPSWRQKEIEEAILWALPEATNNAYLRPNAVDPITGKNTGNNIGEGFPVMHFHQWEEDHLRIALILKGGGSENVGIQYKLPDAALKAGRDLEGVRKCVLDAAHKAQGFACAPGVLGITIGSDRSSGYLRSKEIFLRKLGEPNPSGTLNELEKRLKKEINQLGIGPMGFGGNTTIMDVFINSAHRHPACYFVTVSYTCWAFRRYKMTFKEGVPTYD